MKVRQLFYEFDARYISNRLKLTTQNGYRVNIVNHILPCLGEVGADDLTDYHIDKLVLDCREKGLNNTSVVYVLAVLRRALNWGMKKCLCSNTVMQEYDFPRKSRYSSLLLSAEQIQRLNLRCHRVLPIYPAILLGSRYGLRRGEVLALRESDIDYSASCLTVSRSVVWIGGKPIYSDCKTVRSQRVILLSRSDLDFFLEHRSKFPPVPGNLLLRNRYRAYTQGMLNKEFRALVDVLSLPPIRFHDLRHSCATYMLRQGVNPKIVSHVLGHSSVKVTLDLYTHVDLSSQQSFVDALSVL